MFRSEFHPELSLTIEADGQFTLRVRVLVPNGCYSAGKFSEGAPPDTAQLPETRSFTFEIEERSGICTQAEQYVTAIKSDLEPDQGHRSLAVYVVIGGKVVGQAAIAFPPLATLQALLRTDDPKYPIVPETVSAVVTSDLIGEHTTLTVSCMVEVPNPGFTATLRPLKMGNELSILLLELIVTPPDEVVIQPHSTVVAKYVDENYRGHYSDASIVNQAQVITVPVIAILSFVNAAQTPHFSVMRNAIH
ncbi:hypothetical protein LOC51_30795 [Rubrivivax sp. JA1024]|nr:hypothetical protein [Rubrivivax sp. JA1024]